MSSRILYIALLFLILVSCEKFLDGTINYVDFPEHETSISTSLIVSDVATELHAYVSKTVSISNVEAPQVISNAVVSLKDDDGNVLYTMTNEDFDGEFYKVPFSGTENFPEGNLHLDVDVPEFELVTASTKMPSGTELDFIYEESADTAMIWGWEYVRDRYEFDFENNLEEDDAFLIFFEGKVEDEYSGEIGDWEPLWVEGSIDSRITSIWIYGGILISDESVRNDPTGLHGINLFVANEDFVTVVEKRVRIESLSDELKKYYISLQEYEDNQGSWFTEPDLIYSNVSSGFGCFGMYKYEVFDL